MANAEDLLRRVNELPKGVASAEELEQAQDAVTSAKETLADMGEAIKVAKAEQVDTQAKVNVATAQIALTKAQVTRDQLDVTDSVIKAPIAGRVTHRNVEPGAFVSPGTPLMAIVPTAVFITANFKETQVGEMRSGQSVSITIDAYPKQPLTGQVDSVQSGTGSVFALLPPQNATGNYVKVVQRVPVKIVFTDPIPNGMNLVPGMSVVPRVHVGSHSAVEGPQPLESPIPKRSISETASPTDTRPTSPTRKVTRND